VEPATYPNPQGDLVTRKGTVSPSGKLGGPNDAEVSYWAKNNPEPPQAASKNMAERHWVEESTGLEEEDGPAVPPPRVFKQPWMTRKCVVPRKEECLVSVLRAGAQATVGARLQSCRLEPEEKLLCQENWKMRGIIGIVQDSLIGHGKTVDIVMDSGAGPSFIRAGSLPQGTIAHPLPSNLPGLVSANGSPLKLRGFVKIGVQVGDLVEEESLMVSDSLPVQVFLGTGWIENMLG
jgi:hypothetical protein